jgi:hypothetical protein
MALPSSGPISIGAIYTELTGSAPETLVRQWWLFNDSYATLNLNSPTQPSASAPFSLGSFHGYDQNAGPGLKLFFRSPQESGNPDGTCFTQCDIPQYHNGAGTLPTVGDIVYNDSGGTDPLQSGGNYWGMNEVEGAGVYTFYTFKRSGQVVEVYMCNPE